MQTKTPIQDAAATSETTTKPHTIQAYIKKMEREIARALPSLISPERFTRIVLTAISSNPRLGECTPQSFLAAMMTAAQLGVEPNTPLGQAYLIPYHNKKTGQAECQFQLGYLGMVELAHRGGEIISIQAQVVFEHDEFEYAFGLEPVLRHIPARTQRGAATHVYALFKAKGGGYGFDVMSVEDVRTHANKYAQAAGPWVTNFEEMAKKVVLKRVLKLAPLKSDTAKAITADETVRNDIDANMLDVPPVHADEAATEPVD